MSDVLAWHFVGSTLRDGRPVPADGETLRHDGELVLCESGLHASVRIIDALQYAPGPTICRVRCGSGTTFGAGKLVCTERTILWRVDGAELLSKFGRRCALDVAHLWPAAPEVVLNYLRTGDEALRAAARSAWDAAGGGAWAAAWGGAWAAAWDAAWDAARAAAWEAAWGGAWAAAWDAAWDAQNARLTEMAEAAPR